MLAEIDGQLLEEQVDQARTVLIKEVDDPERALLWMAMGNACACARTNWRRSVSSRFLAE